VWPEAVERAFMEGRNELIAAYIYKETKQSRTRKQVSSHIQVLKNTRKEDQPLMELLSDGSPDESNDPAWLEAAMVKIRKIFGEDRLQDSPSSPTTPISPSDNIHEQFGHLEKRRSLDEEDEEERKPQHNRQLSIASILNPVPEQSQAMLDSSNDEYPEITPQDIAFSSSNPVYSRDERPYSQHTSQYLERNSQEPVVMGSYSPRRMESPPGGQHGNSEGYDPALSYRSEKHMFWPCHFKLIQENNRLYNNHGLPQLLSRESALVEHPAPFHDSLQSQDICALDDTRFPHLKETFNRKRCLFMRCKVVCSVETKQATHYHDRFTYEFRIVDAWLEEFLRTLRDGGQEEMELSLQNMTIVQEFSSQDGPEEEPRLEPLLVIAYEFFAGNGTLNTYRLTSGPPPASVRARSHTWDHPTSPWARNQAGLWNTSEDSRYAHKRPSLESEEWPPQPKKHRREFQSSSFKYAI
ncbi:hypothetical protein BGX27_000943, partial [Mortierella sp. AM989]